MTAMDGFLIKRTYRVERLSGEVLAKLTAQNDTEDFIEVVELFKASLPETLKLFEYPAAREVLNRPPPEPFAAKLPINPKDLVAPGLHWSRIRKQQAALEEHNVTGTEELNNLPAGWLTVLEAAVEGWIQLLAGEPTATAEISQVKEKFGSLRVYAQATGSDDFVEKFHQIREWAEAASVSRCMVTGHRGYIDAEGWIVTLCPQAIFWRRRYPDTFDQIVYPRRPRDQLVK